MAVRSTKGKFDVVVDKAGTGSVTFEQGLDVATGKVVQSPTISGLASEALALRPSADQDLAVYNDVGTLKLRINDAATSTAIEFVGDLVPVTDNASSFGTASKAAPDVFGYDGNFDELYNKAGTSAPQLPKGVKFLTRETDAALSVSDDFQVLVAGTTQVNLPAASAASGRLYNIMNIGVATVTISSAGGNIKCQTLEDVATPGWNDAATLKVDTRGGAVQLVSDGAVWYGMPFGIGVISG